VAITDVPRSWLYTCDGCGVQHKQENAYGHYSNSTPPNWATVRVSRHSGAPVERLLCSHCRVPVLTSLDLQE
jgi:hypothetical protein